MKIGPKIIACGIEHSTTNIVRSGLSDFVKSKIEPINPHPLQIIMNGKMFIESVLKSKSFIALTSWFWVSKTESRHGEQRISLQIGSKME